MNGYLMLFIFLYNFFLNSMEQTQQSVPYPSASHVKRSEFVRICKSLNVPLNASCVQVHYAYRDKIVKNLFNNLVELAHLSEDVAAVSSYILRRNLLKEGLHDQRSPHEIFSKEQVIIHRLFCRRSEKSKKNNETRSQEEPRIPSACLTLNQLRSSDLPIEDFPYEPYLSADQAKGSEFDTVCKSLNLPPNASCAQVHDAYRYEMVEMFFNHIVALSDLYEKVAAVLSSIIGCKLLQEELPDQRPQHEMFLEEKDIIQGLFCGRSEKSKKNESRRASEEPKIPSACLLINELFSPDLPIEDFNPYFSHISVDIPHENVEGYAQPACDRITPDLMGEREIEGEDKDEDDPDSFIINDN